MNRGVVLGAILMIALIIYIVADTRSFSNAKPELKAYADSFVSDYVSAGVTPEAYRTVDATSCSKECTDKIRENLQKVVNEYMTPMESANTDSMYGYYYGVNASELIEQIGIAADASNFGYVSKISAVPQKDTTIKKSGVDLAQVIISYDLTVEYAGNPYVQLPALSTSINYYDPQNAPEFSDETARAKGEIELELTLKKMDGQWRIAYVDWLNYSLYEQNSGTEYDFDMDSEDDSIAITAGGFE